METTEAIIARIFRPKTALEIQARDLLKKVVSGSFSFREQESGCVELISHTAKTDGYSRVGVGRISKLVHRLIFFCAFPETDTSLCILHKCDNPACCRLDHLFAGTQTDNMEDKIKKGRQRSGSSFGVEHPRSVLTAEQVREIRASKRHHGNVTSLARRYNVALGTIKSVLNHKTYHNI